MAYKTKADLLILDDLQARLVAQELELNITGTLGVLGAAYQKGMLLSLEGTLEALKSADFRITPELNVLHAGAIYKKMICDICGSKGAKTKKITRSYGKGKELFVIEDIPVVTCTECGEEYLTADTLHELERIKLHKNKFGRKRQVQVAEYV